MPRRAAPGPRRPRPRRSGAASSWSAGLRPGTRGRGCRRRGPKSETGQLGCQLVRVSNGLSADRRIAFLPVNIGAGERTRTADLLITKEGEWTRGATPIATRARPADARRASGRPRGRGTPQCSRNGRVPWRSRQPTCRQRSCGPPLPESASARSGPAAPTRRSGLPAAGRRPDCRRGGRRNRYPDSRDRTCRTPWTVPSTWRRTIDPGSRQTRTSAHPGSTSSARARLEADIANRREVLKGRAELVR